MIPKDYTDAERKAYARARGDAARDFQDTLAAGIRPTQDVAWCEGFAAGQALVDDSHEPFDPPADRPYAPQRTVLLADGEELGEVIGPIEFVPDEEPT